MKRKRPETMAAEASQRAAVRLRSNGQCEFERRQWSVRLGRYEFLRCDRAGWHTAHIFRRWKTCRAAKFDPVVALNACADCHVGFDAYEEWVRAPVEMARAAWDLIVAACKSADGLGPRP